MKKFIAFLFLCSCLSLGAFTGAAFALTDAEVSTLQHPNGPLHDNANCDICHPFSRNL